MTIWGRVCALLTVNLAEFARKKVSVQDAVCSQYRLMLR